MTIKTLASKLDKQEAHTKTFSTMRPEFDHWYSEKFYGDVVVKMVLSATGQMTLMAWDAANPFDAIITEDEGLFFLAIFSALQS
jgi:hypothetical protein